MVCEYMCVCVYVLCGGGVDSEGGLEVVEALN